jgi:hypothetical protein
MSIVGKQAVIHLEVGFPDGPPTEIPGGVVERSAVCPATEPFL